MALDSARGIMDFGTSGTGGTSEKAGRIGRIGRIRTGETSGTGGTSETGETSETSGVFFCFCGLSFVICNYFVSLSLEIYNSKLIIIKNAAFSDYR